MTDVVPRSLTGFGAQRSRSRRALVALAVLVVAALGFASPGSGSPSIRTATSGCVAVGGGAVSSGGPQRATVVVDTGAGTVWSACISFSGSVSGIKALELAQATIGGLNPVYDTYAGQGKAVCRLLGVGTDPPDCLGKDVNYWNYYANGAYARGGAGNTTVNDGDVQGWRFGTGAAPRAATAGTAATSAPPPTTAPPVPPPTTAPPAPGTNGGAISGSTGAPQSSGADGSAPVPDPNDPAADPSEDLVGAEPNGEATSTTVVEATDVAAVNAERRESDDAAVDESAATSTAPGGRSPADPASGSSWPAAFGFLAALAAVGAGLLAVRHRRTTAP